MKTLIFRFRKSTEEEIKYSLLKNPGSKPFDYAIHAEYWVENMSEKPDGDFNLSRGSQIGNLLDAVKRVEKML